MSVGHSAWPWLRGQRQTWAKCMRGLIDSLRKIGALPMLTAFGALLGVAGIIAWLGIGGSQTARMGLLYDNLDQHDVAQITERLLREFLVKKGYTQHAAK